MSVKNILLFFISTCLLFSIESFAQTSENALLNSQRFEKNFETKRDIIGAAGNSVNLVSGNINLPVTLVALDGKNGLNINVSIQYNSAGIEKLADTWNSESPTGILGLGWSMDIPKIIADNKQTGAKEDDEYYLIEGGQTVKLIRKGNDPSNSAIKTYDIKNGGNWKISYNPSYELWEIIKEDGTKYQYGGANFGENAVQWIVRWGNWIGSSVKTYNDSGSFFIQQQQAVAWNLSGILNTSQDQIVFEYDPVEQYVGRISGLKHTEATYLKKIRDTFGRTVQFFYNEKLADEYTEPHTEQAEPDAYQEVYERRYLDHIEVYNQGNKLLSSSAFTYSFIDKGNGSKKLTKRLLTNITEKNMGGDTNSPTKFEYFTSGVNYGKLRTLTSPGGGKASYTYSEGITLSNSRRDLTINAPSGFGEPDMQYGKDYVVVTWRYLGSGQNHTSGGVDVRVMVYTWEGAWVEQDLGIIPNVKHTLTWDNMHRVDFLSTQQEDFFAFMNPSSNENYVVYLFRRNKGSRGKWEREDNTIRTGNYAEKPVLRSGDHFVSVHAKRLGTISTFILANDRWIRKDLDAGYGQPYGEYYSTAGNNYIISHNEDGTPDNINFFYLDEQMQWQRRILPNSVLFNSTGISYWYGSNAFALAMAEGNPEYIYQWDENYNNFSRKDILGSYADNSNVDIYNENFAIAEKTGDYTYKIRGARFDGATWYTTPIEWNEEAVSKVK